MPIDLVQACILSQPLVQALHTKKFDYRYYCITVKVSRDYIGNLIQHRKTQSLYEKALIGPKRAVFSFFQSSMGGFSSPKPPPCVRHCAPLKPMSRREIKLNAKPLITKGILISIKTRNRLFKSCYQCQDPVKIEHYQKYRNKLTHIKALAEQQHYDSLLRKNSNNPKKSWSVIREIIDNKSTSNINLPPTLRVNNKACETNSNEFLDHMRKYFANIGSTL